MFEPQHTFTFNDHDQDDLEHDLDMSKVGEDLARLFSAFLILILAMSSFKVQQELKSAPTETVKTSSLAKPQDNEKVVHLENWGDVVVHEGKKWPIHDIKNLLSMVRQDHPQAILRVIVDTPERPLFQILDALEQEGVSGSQLQYRRLIP